MFLFLDNPPRAPIDRGLLEPIGGTPYRTTRANFGEIGVVAGQRCSGRGYVIPGFLRGRGGSVSGDETVRPMMVS